MNEENQPPLRVRESDSNPNLIPVYQMVFSGATVERLGPTGALITVDSGGGSGTTFTIPLIAGSGGTGQTTNTAFALLYGSGGNPIQALPTMASGQIVVGSGTSMRPHVLGTGGAGTMLMTSGGVIGGLAWVTTVGAGGVVYAPTGGNYLAFAADADLTAEKTLTSSSGLTTTTDATTFLMSVNTNVRDKVLGFFFSGALSTTMLSEQARIRIPFNMQVIRVDLSAATPPTLSGITASLIQYGHPNSAGVVFFTTSANLPQIPAGAGAGSSLTFDTTILTSGSYLGIDLLQVGSATATGSGLTVTIITRSS